MSPHTTREDFGTPASKEGRGTRGTVIEATRHCEDALFRQIAERSPVGIALIDREGIFGFVNPAYCAMHLRRENELIGRPFTLLLREEQRDASLARHRRFLDGAGDLDGYSEVVRHDGTTICTSAVSTRVSHGGKGQCRAVYVLDVTAQRRIEQSLRASQHFAQSVLDGLGGHICVIDQAGTIVTVNRAWREFAAANGGTAAAVLEGSNYLATCEAAARSGANDDAEARRFVTALGELLAGRCRRFEFEYPCHSPDEQRWYSARLSRIDDSEPPRFVVMHVNVTDLKLAEQVLQREATTDDLTDVPNRRRFLHALNAQLERVRRHPGVASTLLSMDIDHFKRVNDTHGHAAGDAVLVHLAQLVSAQIRPMDILGRLGGEEFGILLPDTDVESAMALGQRLGRCIAEQSVRFADLAIPVTASFGATPLSAADASIDAALVRADEALYEAKDSGRNTIRLHLPAA